MSQPSTLLEQIISDPDYEKNLNWGEPRPGHPEGTIGAHIAELERNLVRLTGKLSEEQSELLRVLIHTHDTFKPNAKKGVSITHPKSHASLAREFLARYCSEKTLLDIVQYHDEPFAIWRKHKQGGADSDRFLALINTIDDWDLFLAFLIVDGCTEGKSTEPLLWFLTEIEEHVDSKVDVHWLKLMND